MPILPFYIVDVFAEEKYAGNQLAVVRGAPSQMQQIALEMNYAETTFITSDQARDGGYDVRIFTNTEELPFAGHPTLGTAYIIARELIGGTVETVTLNLKVGQIPVTFRGDVLWMQQKPPTFGGIVDAEHAAAAFGLALTDIDTRFPIQTVSTGVPFVMLPLKSREAIKRARLNVEAQAPFREQSGTGWTLLFCPEPYSAQNHLNVRVLIPDSAGVWEDAATGSANGNLAGYLARYRYFGEPRIDVRVEQGYEMNRPSLLLLQAEDHGDTVEVHVGGRVQMVARGELV